MYEPPELLSGDLFQNSEWFTRRTQRGAALDLAVALDSTDADLYVLRAEVREALGDLVGAVEDLSIARAMRPADATLVEALRLARRRLGSGSEPAH